MHHSIWSRGGLFVAVACLCCSGNCSLLSAQESTHKNSVGVSFAGMRFMPSEQYLGVGAYYRFSPKPWYAVQVETAWFPHKQYLQDQYTGYSLTQFDAVGMVGRRFKGVRVSVQGGVGVIKSVVYAGTNFNSYIARYYPDTLMGIAIDIPVSPRWSVGFTGRDNLTYIPQYTYYNPFISQTVALPSGYVNAPEGRASVAFHF